MATTADAQLRSAAAANVPNHNGSSSPVHPLPQQLLREWDKVGVVMV